MQTDVRSGPSALRSRVELFYVAAFVAVEVLGLLHPFATAVGHAILIVALINHYILAERDQRQPLLLALAVVCLYRLLSFTPLPSNDFTNHLVLVGAPMLFGTILALRVVRPPGVGTVLRSHSLGWQIAIAASGVPLSTIAYKLLKPGFVVTISGPQRSHAAVIAGVILALSIFSGIGEEVLFRVLVHSAARTTFGSAALYVSSLIYGAAYFGTRSIPFVLFTTGVGAFFGWCYERTGSILGPAIAHSVISIGVFVIWPSLAHVAHL